MAKKVIGMVKLQIPAGQANPSPPVGPALGQHGVNIMEFCKAFNAQTKNQEGTIIPVVITIYADRSFSFITKTPPAAVLLKKAAGIVKGSGEPNRNEGGTGDPRPGEGNCPDQASGPERGQPGGGHSTPSKEQPGRWASISLKDEDMSRRGKKYVEAKKEG